MGTGENKTLLRQWAMLRCIPRLPARISVLQLAESLETQGHSVSKRTIERDLHALSEQFPLIVDERSKPYGWSWAKGASLQFLPSLTPAQSVALLLAREHLNTLLPANLHKELQPVFEAAERGLAATGWRDWHKRTAVIPTGIAMLPPAIAPGTMEQVQAAIARGRCIEADYRSKGQTESKRLRIHPLGLLARGSVLYLVCTIFDYQDLRQLAVHRLKKVFLLDQPRAEKAGFTVAEYARSEGRVLGSQGRVRLVARFDPAAAEHLSETALSTDQTLSAVEDGQRVELCATVEDDDRLHWWLLGFGPLVEVVLPASLRDAQRRAHESSAKRYSGAPADDPFSH